MAGNIHGAMNTEQMMIYESGQAVVSGLPPSYARSTERLRSQQSGRRRLSHLAPQMFRQGDTMVGKEESPDSSRQTSARNTNPVPAINVGPGATAARFHGSQSSARGEHVGALQRNYTAPEYQRGARGASNNGSYGRRGHVHSRNSSMNQSAQLMSPPRIGGSWAGGRGRGRHRGGYSGHRGSSSNYMPPYGGNPYEYSGFEGRAQAQLQSGPQNEAHAQAGCRNENAGGGRFSYKPCSCYKCNVNNRSVMVRVDERPDTPIMEVQSRIKYGLGERFGEVDAVFPTELQDGIGFLVRFRYESSVPDALAFGSGEIHHWNMSVAISAAMKSKWVNTTWPQAVQNTGYQPMQAQYQPAMPMPNHPPMPFGYQNMVPSHAPYPTMPDFGRTQPQPPFVPIYEHAGMFPLPAYPVYPVPLQAPVVADPFASGPQHAPAVAVTSYDTQLHHANKATEHRPNLAQSAFEHQVPYALTSTKQHQGVSETATAQSKPPCEEALDDLNRQGNPSVTTPESAGATASPSKARVVLPAPTTPTMATKGGRSERAKEHYGEPEEPERGQGYQDTKRAARDAAPGTPTPKQKRSKEPEMDPSKENADSKDAQSPTPGASKDSAPDVVGNKQETKPAAPRRAPSIFTEDQIKIRKRLWDRIPMPLDPLKAKKPVDASGGPAPTPAAEKNATAKGQESAGSEPEFVRWIEVRSTNRVGKDEGEAPVKSSDVVNPNLPARASSSSTADWEKLDPTEPSGGIHRDSHSSQNLGDSSGMTAQSSAPMSSQHSHGPAGRGRGHFRQQSRGRRHHPSQPMSGRSSRQSSHSNQSGAFDSESQGAHSRQASQSGPGITESGNSAADGRGSIRKKRNPKKKSRGMASSTFVPMQEAPEAHQPHGDGAPGPAAAGINQGGDDMASHVAAQSMSRPLPGSMGPPTKLPIRTRNVPTVGDQISSPSQESHSQGQASGSHPGPAQPQQSRHHYRSDAGGSLRMNKSRRGRVQQQLFDAPPTAEQTDGAQPPPTPHAPTTAQSLDAEAQQSVGSPQGGGQQQQQSYASSPGGESPAKVILLNPRAEAFVSPRLPTVDAEKKEAHVEGEKIEGESKPQNE
ncbi:hypothetical protein JDV02_009812 [Purpureocillium takamizusanense]|uniref:Uncharacterized protein n=1 Tax=Purpureocillium takamizusanense TaxID=2060973 RepID=A0A9Q8VGQ9_9HYPO|nr:uncharacterized protein JDV02_009812 [Purpureocillium takamizusanense]UNI24032.1 hypothetical protein JDV02_009812 [Purpureocillium takamizusanense]